MKKIGILGGTFDPPHLGHLIIANEVLHSMLLDEIWFMPNQEPPHKKKSNAISNIERVHLLKLAIEGHPKFRIEMIELERTGPSYTYETMMVLKERHKNKQFFFIIGADMVEFLPEWKNIDQLLDIVQFIGVKRPSYKCESSYPILYAEVPEMGISSSMIRDRIKEGRTIRYLVPDLVKDYIEEKALYGS